MKRKFKFLLVIALFVCVSIGSVAFFGVKANAETKVIPAGYVTEGLAHFYDAAGQPSGSTLVDYQGTADGTIEGKATVDDKGLHITKLGSVHANGAAATFEGDFTAEFYIQDFKRGDNSGYSYLFTVGTSGETKFHVGVWHDMDRFIIKKDKTELNLDFMNATANLQDALVSIVYDADTTSGTLKFYLNGVLLKTISHSTISAISDVDFVQIGDGGGYWATETFKSIRFYNKVLTSAQIRTNYEVDYAKYSKNIDHENNKVILPSWRDYKYSTNEIEHLKGYFAGQDPLITGYYDIICQSGDIPEKGKIPDDYYNNAIKGNYYKNTASLDKAFTQLWNNLANQDYGTALYDHLDLTLETHSDASVYSKITGYTANYLDRDGYHSNTRAHRVTLFQKTGDCIDRNTPETGLNDVESEVNKWVGTGGFTIELFLGDFELIGDGRQELLYMPSPNGSGEKEFMLYYYPNHISSGNNELIIKCPIKGTGGTWYSLEERCRPRYKINSEKLKDSLISIVFQESGYYKLYINGIEQNATVWDKEIGTFDKEHINNRDDGKLRVEQGENNWLHNTDFDFINPGWKTVQLGGYNSNHPLWYPTKCTYRCVRVYDTALTSDQIAANYANDEKLYHKTTTTAYRTPLKQKTSYGLVGFDKILENNSYGVGKELRFTQDNITNTNGNGGYVNELLNDWEPATNLNVTKTERLKYFVALLNNGESSNGTATYVRTPIRIDQRATFYDLSTLQSHRTDFFRGRMEGPTLAITDSGMGEKFARTHDENGVKKIDEWYENNAVLAIQNSFYMRSKYKCGDSSIKVEDGKIVDSTKLMVTADIAPDTLRDTNFCGMVIDFSDDIWNRYDPNMDYSGYEWTGHARDDSMYTHYDSELNASNNFCRTSLFETGVGFNLIRSINVNGVEEGSSYTLKMRVFVGGDGNANSTKYKDITISGIQNLNNYTIYREYTTWPFATTTLGDWVLTKDTTNVYLVKFYVNKTMVAIVVMGIANNASLSNGSSPLAGATGYIIPVNDGSLDVNEKVKTCTFRDWRQKCNYGIEGKHVENTTVNDPRNATASGNILFAVNRKNHMFEYGIDPNKNVSDGFQMSATDEDLCRIIIDNIGYMDYHDTDYTQKTYQQAYIVNKDMTLNLASSLVFARRVFEPDIYFNRLAYDSSLLKYSDLIISDAKTSFEKGRAISDFKFNGVSYTQADYNASHNKATLLKNGPQPGGEGSKITMYSNSVDGVYFKDIADRITYDFIDFNGETMFTKDMSAIEYFQSLYNDYIGENTLGMTKNQIMVMLDLIELGESNSKLDKYYKLKEYYPTHDIGALEDFKIEGEGVSDLFDTAQVISENFAGKIANKPKMINGNSDTDINFYGFNVLIKNYVSLLVRVKAPTEWEDNLSEHLKIWYFSGEKTNPKGKEYQYVFYNDNQINLYHDGKVNALMTTIEKIDDTYSYFTVEIKLAISDFNKQFYFELLDGTEVKSRFVYGLYNYCSAKWNDKDKNLAEYVQRLFHIGEMAPYFDLPNEFKLWKEIESAQV